MSSASDRLNQIHALEIEMAFGPWSLVSVQSEPRGTSGGPIPSAHGKALVADGTRAHMLDT